jgi:DNA-binding NarL/FixJ family response regulator
MATINVVIADSSTESREQLNNMLAGSSDMNVVADAKDGREAVELVKSLTPDVLICDVNIGGLDADVVTERCALAPEPTGVIIVSAVSDLPIVRAVYGLLYEDLDAQGAVRSLMSLPVGRELAALRF